MRILGGYCGGLVLGVALGAGMYFFPPVCVLMKPFLTVVRSTPVASFILIAYFIITDTAIPLFITLLMVLPMIASTVFTALGSTDRTLLEMASVYRFSFGKPRSTLDKRVEDRYNRRQGANTADLGKREIV